MMKLTLSLMLLMGGAACVQETGDERPLGAEIGAEARQDGYGEDAPTTAAGPLQANWRVTRPGDPSDGAVMLLHIIHDGDRLEGSYLLFQPFCWIERPLPQPLGDDCEFTDMGADFAQGAVTDGAARLVFRPGADGLDHVLTFAAFEGDRIEGAYAPPGTETPIPVVLERLPF